MSSLDLDLLAPADRQITVTVAGERRAFPIRGSMPIPKMIRLLRLETRINLAYAEEPAAEGKPVEELADVFQDIYDEIFNVIRERTPDAPDFDLDENQALAILGFIAGDDSVAQAVTAAIAAPEGDTGSHEAVTTAPVASSAADVAEAGGTPLESTKLSQTPSSGSDESTGGGPSGGVTSPGVLSDSTFETLTPV